MTSIQSTALPGVLTTLVANATASWERSEMAIHWTALIIEISILVIGVLLTACCYYCCFRMKLREDGAVGSSGVLDTMQNGLYKKQEAEFLNGNEEQKMTVITKFIGEEKVTELQKVLKEKNLEIDTSQLNTEITKYGPEVVKMMARERMSMNDAITKIAERRAEEEMMKATQNDGNEGTDQPKDSSDNSPMPAVEPQ
ncbi:hypothetical protein QR680_009384 [Steinernema hermaphroditum]|uniref:Uncharacterized protein n=1 Tax=Steinernema hermaphroditum TaxID=289476 RepID=A0AA39ILF3_9BILA|nr:hypothetical protein QR680_009384 [Steinernema hermaphroditum]